MNAKTKHPADGFGALPRLRLALSALCLVAASPAFAGADCTAGSRATPCDKPPKHTTYRILQNLIPQPFVTYTPAPALPPTESVRFVPRAAFATNQAGVTPELGDELMGFLASLEGYQRIERFEVIGYGDGGLRDDLALRLADKRTAAVRDFLVERGIAATMLEGRGVARPEPATLGHVEILVTVRGRR